MKVTNYLRLYFAKRTGETITGKAERVGGGSGDEGHPLLSTTTKKSSFFNENIG